jgi:ATP-binding cassette subfamily C (CFTR/MRP) protein 1
MANSVVFSHLVEEYGNTDSDDDSVDAEKQVVSRDRANSKANRDGPQENGDVAEGKKGSGALMQDEEREKGSVGWYVFASYLRAAGGLYWGVWLLTGLTLSQAANGAFLSHFFGLGSDAEHCVCSW